eukprot:Hpha_TRINITY_DN15995_c0_g1::TRINITY_DN15995_c0_g1_i5::g.73849::m.73849
MCVRLIHTTHNNMSRGATLAEPLLASSAGEDTIPAPGTSSSVGSGLVPSLIQGSGAGLGPANLLSKPLLGPSSGAAASFKSPNFKTSSPPGTSRTAGSDLIPSQIPFGPVSAPGYAGSPLKPSSARSVQAKGAGSIPRSTVSKAKENKVIEQTRDMGSSARAMQRDTLRLLESAECSTEPAQIEMDLKLLLHAPVPWCMSKENYDRRRQQKLNNLCSTPYAMHLFKEFAGRFESCLELIEKGKQSSHAVEAKSHDAAAAFASKAEDFEASMKLPPRERKVCFWDADESAEPMKLLEWIYTLPEVKPSLGYVSYHIKTLLTVQIKSAVKRERDSIAKMLKIAEGAAGVQVADWVVALALEGAER